MTAHLDPSEALRSLKVLKRGYEAALRPVEQDYCLTRNEVDVLLFLANNPGYDTASDMVELRGLSKSHVCKSVDRLGSLGYLAAAQDAQDRRRVHLSLQPAARPAVQAAQGAQREFFQALYQGVTPAELETVARVLEKVCNNNRKAMERWR